MKVKLPMLLDRLSTLIGINETTGKQIHATLQELSECVGDDDHVVPEENLSSAKVEKVPPFRKGDRVRILTGDITGSTAKVLWMRSKEYRELDTQWEFKLIDGDRKGSITWRKQKNLCLLSHVQNNQPVIS